MAKINETVGGGAQLFSKLTKYRLKTIGFVQLNLPKYQLLSAFRKRWQIKDKEIKLVKNWPKPKPMRNIQIFLSCANFYWPVIQGFHKTTPLTLMLKTPRSAENLLASVDRPEDF